MPQIDVDDLKINRFTTAAKLSYVRHIERYAGDLIEESHRLTDNFEAIGSDVTPVTVDNANVNIRRFNIRKRNGWYIFKLNASLVLGLISGGSIGKVFDDLSKALKENVIITLIAVVSLLLFIYFSSEVNKEA